MSYTRAANRDASRAIDAAPGDDEWHVWTFDGDGEVSSLRHVIDTKKHLDARRGD